MFGKRKGRPSLREQIEKHNASDRYYAASFGKEPAFQRELPPKRDRVKRPVDGKPVRPLESAVNEAIHDVVKKLKQGPLWRNNRGLAQYGNSMVAYGVGPKGAADHIGYRRVLITADMVGSFVAQFVAVEAKRTGAETRDDQQAFLDRVVADGGCAGCATSAEEAEAILTAWPRKAGE